MELEDELEDFLSWGKDMFFFDGICFKEALKSEQFVWEKPSEMLEHVGDGWLDVG